MGLFLYDWEILLACAWIAPVALAGLQDARRGKVNVIVLVVSLALAVALFAVKLSWLTPGALRDYCLSLVFMLGLLVVPLCGTRRAGAADFLIMPQFALVLGLYGVGIVGLGLVVGVMHGLIGADRTADVRLVGYCALALVVGAGATAVSYAL